jgi:hypothetical protein
MEGVSDEEGTKLISKLLNTMGVGEYTGLLIKVAI